MPFSGHDKGYFSHELTPSVVTYRRPEQDQKDKINQHPNSSTNWTHLLTSQEGDTVRACIICLGYITDISEIVKEQIKDSNE